MSPAVRPSPRHEIPPFPDSVEIGGLSGDVASAAAEDSSGMTAEPRPSHMAWGVDALDTTVPILTPEELPLAHPRRSHDTSDAEDNLKGGRRFSPESGIASRRIAPPPRTDISCALLLSPRRPIDLEKVMRELPRLTGQSPESVATRIRAQCGILFPHISYSEGTRLRDGLRQAGVAVSLVEEQSGWDAADVIEVRGLKAKADAWQWETREGQTRTEARSLALMSCGCVRLVHSDHRRRCMVDLFWREPHVHLRLWDYRFGFDLLRGLEGFSPPKPGGAPATALRDLAKALLSNAPQAVAAYSLREWLGPESPDMPRRFSDTGAYDYYNLWHLLAYLGREVE
jgi:hypothetical protein